MLDHSKLMLEIKKCAPFLFIEYEQNSANVLKAWKTLSENSVFCDRLSSFSHEQYPTPSWQGNVDQFFPIPSMTESYGVLSVDGSQIYPERHVKSECFLINIGEVYLQYLQHQPGVVRLETTPFIYPFASYKQELSVLWINALRHQHELEYGFHHAHVFKHGTTMRNWLLFDGSLIFWHLEQQKALKDHFLPIYLTYLSYGQKEQIYAAGYISDPKSKDLINILRLFLCDFNLKNETAYAAVNHMVDALLVKWYVPEGCRTTIFTSRSSIIEYYPPSLAPCFFYMNVGREVARVEFPAWMVTNAAVIDALAVCIKDQVEKGAGYPVVLAEAHEQAVVKASDREFFYNCLEVAKRKQQPHIVHSNQWSQKLTRKKSMHV